MCTVKLFPIFGFIFIGFSVFGLLSSLNPKCEYPERRLVAPIVKMLIWSSIGLFLLAMGGILPVSFGTCSTTGTCSTAPITLCPGSLFLSLVFVYALIYAIKCCAPPHYWRRRLLSWAGHNRFTLLDFAKLHSGSGERACFKVALRDASGKERRAEITLGSKAGFNLNHVNLVWLD